MHNDEFGWSGPDASSGMGGLGVVVLLVTSVAYGALIWIAGGLPPLQFLGVHTPRRRANPRQGESERL